MGTAVSKLREITLKDEKNKFPYPKMNPLVSVPQFHPS